MELTFCNNAPMSTYSFEITYALTFTENLRTLNSEKKSLHENRSREAEILIISTTSFPSDIFIEVRMMHKEVHQNIWLNHCDKF